jgi:hypothetical protein
VPERSSGRALRLRPAKYAGLRSGCLVAPNMKHTRRARLFDKTPALAIIEAAVDPL